MALGLEVAFADDCVFFPAGHLSRIGRTFDGTVTAAAIRDADPAAAPPEIRTLAGETLFISAAQRADLDRFCQAHQVPARKRPDIWGDLLEPFLGTQPQLETDAQARLHQAGLSTAEIDQIRAKAGPLMTAYNTFHGDWAHLGLADLLDAMTATLAPRGLPPGGGRGQQLLHVGDGNREPHRSAARGRRCVSPARRKGWT